MVASPHPSSLCAKVLAGDRALDPAEWRFLLTGGSTLTRPPPATPAPAWLTSKEWQTICGLSTLPAFADLPVSIAADGAAWRAWAETADPEECKLPGFWEARDEGESEGEGDGEIGGGGAAAGEVTSSERTGLSQFQKLLVLRCLRPDKNVPAIKAFVTRQLGREYLEPPAFSMEASFGESSCTSPLVFVLSPGADPISHIREFAKARGCSEWVVSVSLGQGQGPMAERVVREGMRIGTWVVLQNCHLMPSWMQSLEALCESFSTDTCQHWFRLWLTSAPSKAFPVPVLQQSVKLIREPPRGIRANLMASYSGVKDAYFDECARPVQFRQLYFALAWFHAVIQERRKFGPLGFNIDYIFHQSDFRICTQQLRHFLDSGEEGEEGDVPFDALRYTAGELNYGGRLTDEKDRRLCMSILHGVYHPDTLKPEGQGLSPGGIYSVPPVDHLRTIDVKEYIRSLPLQDQPEAFGLHANADITCARNETFALFTTLLELQPRSAEGR